MAQHDLIVIGGSAGGVEALSTLVAGLPVDLQAAVCVVIHLHPYSRGGLANVISRIGPLPVEAATDGTVLKRGTIYVAVPDRHMLLLTDGDELRIRLVRGPRENRNRPAIDPLFRSAALAVGARTIGVVLSGALDDGTAGLWSIRDAGGITVVQDPADALVASMPRSALEEAGADHVAPARELGALLGRLARQPSASRGENPDDVDVLANEVALAAIDEDVHRSPERDGVPSRFACPDCGGVLWDVSEGGPLRFRCETGHAYSPASLDEQQMQTIEEALWAALRAVEDRQALARTRAERATARGMDAFAARFTVQAEAAEQHGAVLRHLLRHSGGSGITRRDDD